MWDQTYRHLHPRHFCREFGYPTNTLPAYWAGQLVSLPFCSLPEVRHLPPHLRGLRPVSTSGEATIVFVSVRMGSQSSPIDIAFVRFNPRQLPSDRLKGIPQHPLEKERALLPKLKRVAIAFPIFCAGTHIVSGVVINRPRLNTVIWGCCPMLPCETVHRKALQAIRFIRLCS